jgi:hypothetical protein
MAESPVSSSQFHTLFQRHELSTGECLSFPRPDAPRTVADPSGRLLKIATVDAQAVAICPACETKARGAFVSFVQDLRLAYACPTCQDLVWLRGA